MNESIQEIVKWIESNPLIVTLTSGGAIVWLFANLRSIFGAIAGFVKACISFTIENIYEDNRGNGGGTASSLKLRQIVFNNFIASTKPIWERSVNLDLNDAIDPDTFEDDCKSNKIACACETTWSYGSTLGNGLHPSANAVNTYGFSVRIVLGKLCAVVRSYKVEGQKITMNTTLQVFFASKKKFMKKLEDTINAKVIEQINATESSEYVTVMNGETLAGHKMKRNINSIFTKGNVHKDLLASIKCFINSKDVYKKLNYPYNYCALLHGVPGSGKTSTILAIASELKRNVCYINLSHISTSLLLKAMNENTSSNIYVFEDIDAVSYKGAGTRDKEDGKAVASSNGSDVERAFGVNLSDLLNITDGLLASDGAICLFTTNHIERLDPAFLRAGRMNKTIEFTYMTPEVSRMMVEAYLGDVDVDNIADNIKPAELQECILDILLGRATVDDLKSKFCTVLSCQL